MFDLAVALTPMLIETRQYFDPYRVYKYIFDYFSYIAKAGYLLFYVLAGTFLAVQIQKSPVNI